MNREQQYRLLIKQFEKEYVLFMGIEKLPEYKLEMYEIKIEKANASGFGAIAQAMYDPKTGGHILRICTNLELKKYVVFHEFTHILDSEEYANRDSTRYAYLSGYTEYHASQVELMILLGAKKITDTITDKSMNSVISTLPNDRTVTDYLNSKHQFVIDMMSRNDFPADIESLKTTLGVLYNYWGLRSICKMQIKDFEESADNTAILQVLPFQVFAVMNIFMDGWFDSAKVEMSFGPYSNALMPIILDKKLK